MSDYYITDADLQSVHLEPGSTQYQEACDYLGIPYTSSLEEINEAFGEAGFYFETEGGCLTNLTGNDDSIITDPDELEPIAHLFNGWVEYESDGQYFRSYFDGKKIHSAEAEHLLYPVKTLDHTTALQTIELLEKYLTDLKYKVS